MDKDNINIKQKKFLINYANTLNAEFSAKAAGYKTPASISLAAKMLNEPKKIKLLNEIIKKNVEKLEITKAFVVQKYLKIIEYAFFEDENGIKEPQLALRALDGLCKQLGDIKFEDLKERKSVFENIEGLDASKI